MGVSVDSRFSHAAWGQSLGGISYPLLADFHPKGALGRACGVYDDEWGEDSRSTVMIDAGGIVRFTELVPDGGERDFDSFCEQAEAMAAAYGEPLPSDPPARGVSTGARLFVKDACGPSRNALRARSNLHLDDQVPVSNISEDPSALAALEQLTGKRQVPCLLIDGKPMLESADIVKELVTRVTGWWS